MSFLPKKRKLMEKIMPQSLGKKSAGTGDIRQAQTKAARRSKASHEEVQVPAQAVARSLEIARNGIQTGSEFALMMSALMSDVVCGRISPQVANATVNAGGKLLKVVEMQLKYGDSEKQGGKFLLTK